MLNVEICELVKKIQQEYAVSEIVDDKYLNMLNSKVQEEVQKNFTEAFSPISEAICTVYVTAIALGKDEAWIKEIYEDSSAIFKNAVEFKTNLAVSIHKTFN